MIGHRELLYNSYNSFYQGWKINPDYENRLQDYLVKRNCITLWIYSSTHFPDESPSLSVILLIPGLLFPHPLTTSSPDIGMRAFINNSVLALDLSCLLWPSLLSLAKPPIQVKLKYGQEWCSLDGMLTIATQNESSCMAKWGAVWHQSLRWN